MKLAYTNADAISYPLFDLSKVSVAQGGFSIDTTILPTTLDYIKRGTLVSISTATRLAKPIKTVKVITGGSTSAPRVTKNNLFKVSDPVLVEGRLESRTISAIDTSNAAYDVWTLSGAITGLAADDIIEQGIGTGAVAYTATVVDKLNEYLIIKVLDADFEGATVLLKQNGSDALAVAYASKVLTISLATTTAGNNTAALIQTAIRALGTVETVDFSTAIVLGASTGTGASLLDPQSIVKIDADYQLSLKPNAMVLETVKYEGTPTVSVVIAAMEIEEVNLPYPITVGLKNALGTRFHFKP